MCIDSLLCTKYFAKHLTFHFLPSDNPGDRYYCCPILQKKKLRFRKGNQLVQGHKALNHRARPRLSHSGNKGLWFRSFGGIQTKGATLMIALSSPRQSWR